MIGNVCVKETGRTRGKAEQGRWGDGETMGSKGVLESGDPHRCVTGFNQVVDQR